ncbi:hypothetical protein BYT27DRAFT_7244274 [Phlegmacium glaucopus]|nr:hypothetical protein BYT27DRAFT_7244274 [Phlegmacium glaucopus]
MKASFIISFFLFVIAANGLHIPANLVLERREANIMTCDQLGSCATLFRREPKGPKKGPKLRITAPTKDQKMQEAGEKFLAMKPHVLDGTSGSANNGRGGHLLTKYCEANPGKEVDCSTETHLCVVSGEPKTLWDDRQLEGGHTRKDVEAHCIDAIFHYSAEQKPSPKDSYAVETKAGHSICIRYIPGDKSHPGTCHPQGVNTAPGNPMPGDRCAATMNTPTNKAHAQKVRCSSVNEDRQS